MLNWLQLLLGELLKLLRLKLLLTMLMVLVMLMAVQTLVPIERAVFRNLRNHRRRHKSREKGACLTNREDCITSRRLQLAEGRTLAAADRASVKLLHIVDKIQRVHVA
mmetsp:Transcript_38551/g.84728  ORF Transcript_38551/g.84728 Transcript_38551/m.84728 type:complete len:108 (-) Transcript_38551:6-329(-)